MIETIGYWMMISGVCIFFVGMILMLAGLGI